MQLTEMDGGGVAWLLPVANLDCLRLLNALAEGVEDKMGFLEQSLRPCSVSSLREISRRGLVTKLEVPAAFREFSTLDTVNTGGTLACLKERRVLVGRRAAEAKSSEELRRLDSALVGLGLMTGAFLRRVTKRLNEGE